MEQTDSGDEPPDHPGRQAGGAGRTVETPVQDEPAALPQPHTSAAGPFRAAWAWLTRQSAPVQALLAFVGLVVAVIALIPDDPKEPDPAPPARSPAPSASAPSAVPSALKSGRALLVSSDAKGQAGDNDSGRPSVSGNGRFVAFTSAAGNLVGAGPRGHYNIYRKDLVSDAIELVSVAQGGGPGDGESQFPSICRSGRFIAFASDATNLASDGNRTTPKRWHVYVRDMLDQTTTLVSVDHNGREGGGDSVNPSLSADCAAVGFESTAGLTDQVPSGPNQVYIRYPAARRLVLASADSAGHPLDGQSFGADINATGDDLAFNTFRDGSYRVHVKNAKSGRLDVISAAFAPRNGERNGFAWPNFSPDGRYVSFRSVAGAAAVNVGPEVYVWDVTARRSLITDVSGRPSGWRDACVNGTSNGTRFAAGMSGGVAGAPYRVIFTVGTGPACKLVYRDLTGADVPVDLGDQQNEIIEPAVNADGRVMAWATRAGPLQVFVCLLDQTGGTPTAVNSCSR